MLENEVIVSCEDLDSKEEGDRMEVENSQQTKVHVSDYEDDINRPKDGDGIGVGDGNDDGDLNGESNIFAPDLGSAIVSKLEDSADVNSEQQQIENEKDLGIEMAELAVSPTQSRSAFNLM